VRLVLLPKEGQGLPPRLRVSLDASIAPPRFTGDVVAVGARLMPPAPPLVPGAYDFSRVAWFQGLGATGKATSLSVLNSRAEETSYRKRLSSHIQSKLEPEYAGLATALVTGDRAAISEAQEEAMRNSGLAHLLSISGLHITAVVAAAMFVILRLLGLSQRLALRWPLVTISAGFGATAGIGYTLLAGAEVPTVRSCVAAILVLGGLAMGREAITLRLVATGALIVLLLWPESLVSPSFQLSFAAITALVALNENARFRALVERREEGLGWRFCRAIFALLMTGIVVEITLTPIALFHFNKAGLYGALANIVAIPWTTFVIMPLLAIALLLSPLGLDGWVWWLVERASSLLLDLATSVAALPGAVTTVPSMPVGAFALMVVGGVWLLLWRSKLRFLGFLPVIIGGWLALSVTPPDVMMTNDGRHLAVRTDQGGYAILRPRTGDFVREMLAEQVGEVRIDADIENTSAARCSDDVCIARLVREGRAYRVMATRSRHFLPWREFTAICQQVDIVMSDRTLPAGCTPQWIKADRPFLAKTGGLSVYLSARIAKVGRQMGDQHPWLNPPQIIPPRRKN
jgi:competence protein ComEC